MQKLISKTLILISVILLLSMIISSCKYLPLPEDVIRPPLGEGNSTRKVDADIFIPKGMVAYTAANSGGRYRTKATDIENDGIEEVVVFYGVLKEYSCRGLLIIQEDENWKLYHEQSYVENDRYAIENADFADISGNGRKEMIIELSTYNNARMFQIIKFDSEVEKMYMFGADRLDIIRNEDSLPMLAVWNYKAGGGFNIDIIRWEDDGFVNATYDAPGFFLKLIPGYEKEESTDGSETIYLADTLLKAGDYKNSLLKIQKNPKENLSNEQKLKISVIEARCLFYLGRAEEALSALSAAELVLGYDADLLFEAFILMADILISEGNIEGAKKVLESSEKLLYNYLKTDYKFHLWQNEYETRLEKLKDLN